jgi:hypothetical protein
MPIPDRRDVAQAPRGVVVQFPIPTVAVWPSGDGAWFVIWRAWAWLHGSRDDAMADAYAIAVAHGVRVVEH